ncbi:MAG: peptidoglycan DD-metalloendopeptidase family protein, partial [Bacteroidales bacterium]|nr:peptidoglycan DD-metalloendopeptidase family protein [Bacteroidales bacterium]
IHYPRSMVNYADTAMKDTIHIPLVWDSSKYSSPTEWNYVTSKFGKRKWRYHYGTDFRLQRGDPVMACFDGVVRISKYSKSYGNIVVLRHSNGLESYYGHLSKRKVNIGDTVKSGEAIGLGGNTGRSYGNHLHLELRYLGTPINPEDIVDFSKGELYCDTLHLCAYNFRYLREVAQLGAIVWHTVRNGETLGALARRYGTSVAAIRRWNSIPSSGSRANLIRVKQRLRVR